jgi:hypothetical protein
MADQRRITINGRPVGPQAVAGKTGQQLDRAAPKKAYRLPEARRAAAAAIEVLDHEFPGAQWLHQARDGLEQYLERCITQFAGTQQPTNAGPINSGSDYRAFARTAEEIKETMAAEEAAVSHAKSVPRYREHPEEAEIPEAEIADPMKQPAPKPAPKGWSM